VTNGHWSPGPSPSSQLQRCSDRAALAACWASSGVESPGTRLVPRKERNARCALGRASTDDAARLGLQFDHVAGWFRSRRGSGSTDNGRWGLVRRPEIRCLRRAQCQAARPAGLWAEVALIDFAHGDDSSLGDCCARFVWGSHAGRVAVNRVREPARPAGTIHLDRIVGASLAAAYADAGADAPAVSDGRPDPRVAA
jgi:hypothetical protein